jgi:hypothetical protein
MVSFVDSRVISASNRFWFASVISSAFARPCLYRMSVSSMFFCAAATASSATL